MMSGKPELEPGNQLATLHRRDKRTYQKLMDSLAPLSRRIIRLFERGQSLDALVRELAAETDAQGSANPTDPPGPSPESLRAAETQVAGAIHEAGRVLGLAWSLRVLADTAAARMTPERRTLYERIGRIHDTFGEPVDVNELVREMREDG